MPKEKLESLRNAFSARDKKRSEKRSVSDKKRKNIVFSLSLQNKVKDFPRINLTTRR